MSDVTRITPRLALIDAEHIKTNKIHYPLFPPYSLHRNSTSLTVVI